jgi:hypothetical protein
MFSASSANNNNNTPGGGGGGGVSRPVQYQRLANSQALKAATRRVTISPRPATVRIQSSTTATTTTAAENAHPTSNSTDSEQTESTTKTTVQPSRPKKRSFAPSFLRMNTDDQVEEAPPDPEDAQLFSPGRGRRFINSNHSSPKRRSPMKGKGGPLGKRLFALRNTLANDTARLSAMSTSAFDLNDPRKRATSTTDLTIVGDISPTKMIHGKHVTLAMVHSHKETRNSDAPDQPLHEEHHPSWVWVSFDISTARSVNLHKTQQLRIYNGVFITCTEVDIVLPSMSHHSNENSEGPPSENHQKCRHILACTQLCEPYPTNAATKLPSMGQILGIQSAAATN